MLMESLICLALNVYHEAKNQSFIGQVAVAQVVMNRVKDNRYPNNVCDVVKQGLTYKWKPSLPIKNRCQFSWYCDGKSDTIMLTDVHGNVIRYNMDAWIDSIEIARLALEGQLQDLTQGATYYFNPRLADPDWQYAFTQVATIDNHTFFVH